MQAFNLSTQERRQRQEDIYEFEVSLIYIVRPSQKKNVILARLQMLFISKKKKERKKNQYYHLIQNKLFFPYKNQYYHLKSVNLSLHVGSSAHQVVRGSKKVDGSAPTKKSSKTVLIQQWNSRLDTSYVFRHMHLWAHGLQVLTSLPFLREYST